jgi:hypothetical protein
MCCAHIPAKRRTALSAYPKIPQVAPEKSCEGFNADFSKP